MIYKKLRRAILSAFVLGYTVSPAPMTQAAPVSTDSQEIDLEPG